jgi:hypothetical protein
MKLNTFKQNNCKRWSNLSNNRLVRGGLKEYPTKFHHGITHGFFFIRNLPLLWEGRWKKERIMGRSKGCEIHDICNPTQFSQRMTTLYVSIVISLHFSTFRWINKRTCMNEELKHQLLIRKDQCRAITKSWKKKLIIRRIQFHKDAQKVLELIKHRAWLSSMNKHTEPSNIFPHDCFVSSAKNSKFYDRGYNTWASKHLSFV